MCSKEKELRGIGRCQPGTKMRSIQYHDDNFCHLQGFLIFSLKEANQLTCKEASNLLIELGTLHIVFYLHKLI